MFDIWERQLKSYFTFSNLRRNKKKILGQCLCSMFMQSMLRSDDILFACTINSHGHMVSSDILNCRSSFFKWDNDSSFWRVWVVFFFCSTAVSIAIHCIVYHLFLALGYEGFGVLSLVRVWELCMCVCVREGFFTLWIGLFFFCNVSDVVGLSMSSLCFSFIWRVIYLTFPIAIGSFSICSLSCLLHFWH